MALSLSSLRTLTVADQPPRVLIYGPYGIGKTSLAAEFPSPVFLQLEDGTPNGIRPKGWGRADLPDFESVMAALAILYNDDHEFRTLVVDSATEMQKLVFAETCRRGDEKGNAKAKFDPKVEPQITKFSELRFPPFKDITAERQAKWLEAWNRQIGR